MKNKFNALVVADVLMLLLTVPLSARIGDDTTACASRYGVAIEASPDGEFIVFQKNGIRVSCVFANGACSSISYSLIPTGFVIREELGKEPRFTQEQASRILNLNRRGSTWSQVSKANYGEKADGIYKTSDGKLHALVNSVAVNIESIEFHRAKLAMIETAAVDKTLTSLETGTGNVRNPVIRDFPEVPKKPDPLEDSIKQLEKTSEDLKQSMETKNRAAAEAIASLELVAKRVQKRQEMKDMLVRFKDLEADFAAAKSPEVLKALRAKESALTEEMTQMAKDYEALDAAFKKSKTTDNSPAGK